MLRSGRCRARTSILPGHRNGANNVRETLVVPAELAELARIRNWTEALSRSLVLSGPALFAIQLCFEETFSNITRYAYPDTGFPWREVHLSVERAGDKIILTIEDQGMPFDPWSVPSPPKPATVEEASAGGWGIELVRNFARSHTYERRNGINRLTLYLDC
jgi:anti-sigma regulatory factor (Ser/Thr protein kinase)